jgi:hypothetical protein
MLPTGLRLKGIALICICYTFGLPVFLILTGLIGLEGVIIYYLPQQIGFITDVLQQHPVTDDVLSKANLTSLYYVVGWLGLRFTLDNVEKVRRILYKYVSQVFPTWS